MRGLVLAEKPSLMRAIQDAYYAGTFPFDLDFAAFHGHLMGLAAPADYHEEWRKWDLAALPLIPDVFKYLPVDKKSVDAIMARIKGGMNAKKRHKRAITISWLTPAMRSGKGNISSGHSTRPIS